MWIICLCGLGGVSSFISNTTSVSFTTVSGVAGLGGVLTGWEAGATGSGCGGVGSGRVQGILAGLSEIVGMFDQQGLSSFDFVLYLEFVQCFTSTNTMIQTDTVTTYQIKGCDEK